MIPPEYMCPITKRAMLDPVYGPDLVRYDRHAICKWLTMHSNSPSTRQPLTAGQLEPDTALQKEVRSFVQTADEAIQRRRRSAAV